MNRNSIATVLLGACLLGMYSVWAEADAARTQLSLKEKTVLEKPSPLRGAFYVSVTGQEMMTYSARSADNGCTWVQQAPQPDFTTGLPENYRRIPYPGFVDPVNGALLTVMLAMDREDVDRAVHEPKETATDSYIRYRVSLDGGKTFLFDEPVIQEGGYDFKHPLEGLYLGKNAIFLGDMGCRPIRTKQGRIIVPTQMTVLNVEGALETFGSGWDYYQCLMLIGTWKDDHRLAWTVSEPIPADPERTVRGLYEPTLAEMPDGRILCVMRGSNGLKKDPEYQLPSHKWYCVSTDGGFHWSKPEPWRYSNGKEFFSPSSMSQIIHHSNGRYFWIGTISPTNCRGNAPRWPLVMGEIDPASMMLIEESVITIDTKGDGDPDGLQLSNFYAFENRDTGDIVLPMQRWVPQDQYEWVLYRMGVE
ncbi:MAG: exo-alpha-sialidase [Candidatus Hydrogenedentes bacterium]|nr:exo-alpha-sialidase [Candidatus Hydrogenedentota bacterium]